MLMMNKLTCSYQQNCFEFTLSITAGDQVAILGPSGAGKSTLLSLIAGFTPASGGELLIAGERISHQAPAERKLSMLFQEHNLFTHISVRQNLALGLSPNLRLKSEQTQQLEALAKRIGLTPLLDRLPAQLSGGQRQRVALTRCLLRRRPLLLLDEPFSALDPALRQEMLSLTEQLCEEHQLTLLMVSHNLQDARRITNKSIIIDEGRVVWSGETQALLQGRVPEAQRLRLTEN